MMFVHFYCDCQWLRSLRSIRSIQGFTQHLRSTQQLQHMQLAQHYRKRAATQQLCITLIACWAPASFETKESRDVRSCLYGASFCPKWWLVRKVVDKGHVMYRGVWLVGTERKKKREETRRGRRNDQKSLNEDNQSYDIAIARVI